MYFRRFASYLQFLEDIIRLNNNHKFENQVKIGSLV